MNIDPNPVAAAIVTESGHVLVTRRAPGQKLAGFWEFPGGKVEHDETPQGCIVRELGEELSLTVIAGEIIAESVFTYPDGAINLIAVETQIVGGSIALTVHDAFEWHKPADLLDIQLAPADIPIAHEIIRREAAATISPA